ncbi:protein RALF-like 22 [Nymphaea colorata]|uniref:protein RALF-like 22 n=1 Tax=Nymphaea colorata TaxID=210225 RepID=UPI00129DB2E0|nr:protein RALF-like 22 [Nymphaea colorata]
MAFRVPLILLLLAMAMVVATPKAEVASLGSNRWGLSAHNKVVNEHRSCGGSIGQCMDLDEEEMSPPNSGGAAGRRMLYPQSGYISYRALRRNSVPCNTRGQSYYGCQKSAQANPYRRVCSMITHCARILN